MKCILTIALSLSLLTACGPSTPPAAVTGLNTPIKSTQSQTVLASNEALGLPAAGKQGFRIADVTLSPPDNTVSFPTAYPNTLVVEREGAIRRMKSDGTEKYVMYQMTQSERYLNTYFEHLAWAPPKDKVAFFKTTLQGQRSLIVLETNMPVATYRTLVKESAVDILDYAPRWSPDGRWLAFMGMKDGHQFVYVTKADGSMTQTDGSPVRRLSNTFGIGFPLGQNGHYGKGFDFFQWSNDNQHIYFSKGKDIYVMPINNGTPEPILMDADSTFSLSPDNTQLAFIKNNNIYTYSLEKNTVTLRVPSPQLGPKIGPAYYERVQWSPDSKKIGFERNLYLPGTRGVQLFAYDINTESIQELTRGPIPNMWYYAWAPNSKQVVAETTNLEPGESHLMIFSLNIGPLALESKTSGGLFSADWSAG